MTIHRDDRLRKLISHVFFLCLPTFLCPGAILHAEERATVSDGPYLTWLSEGKANVEAVCDAKVLQKSLSGTGSLSLHHPCNGAFVASIRGDSQVPADTYSGVDRFLAVSDVEGHYDELLKLLRAYGIIDADQKWNWGHGHLIFLGDMVDRGDQVTEVLWLIYRLEQEAEAAGGKVHYVLGNHEKMTLEGDIRYLHEKYTKVTEILGKSYRELFGANTELGRWLRSRNAMLKINDMVFVHGGLAPEMASQTLDITEINQAIRLGLMKPELKKTEPTIAWLLGSSGLLWYRGYFKDENLQADQIQAVLDNFAAKRVVVGHTIVPKVDALHDGLVIAIDTSFSKAEKVQALMLDGGRLWRAGISGQREPLALPMR